MNYILPLVIGFLASFLGFLAPSMLNMTTARISIEKGQKEGIQFALGASSIVFIQGFLAVTFTKYLVANPAVIKQFKTAGIFVLLGLSVFFFMQARKKIKVKETQKKGNSYVTGLVMSSLNMLAIPFYLVMATLAESKGWMRIEQPFSTLYVFGAVLGIFSVLTLYGVFAEIIAKRVQFISKNINYILSLLFIVLALSIAIQIFGA